MLEVTLVLAAVGSVWLILLLATLLGGPVLVMLTVGIMIVGLVLGVPTGFWYHVILYRCLQARIPLPRRWWVSPADLHPHLTEAERRRIRPWYRIGGVGFVLSVVGGLSAIGGLLLGR